jgi:hypothetical protein
VLVAVMLWLHLFVFTREAINLSYAVPLLVFVWLRRPALLWTMAGVFYVSSAIKVYWVIPEEAFPPAMDATLLAMQWANITISATVVHFAIALREGLERKNSALAEANAELQAGNEELAATEEEVSRQNEELQSQSEELERQSEELRSQANDLHAGNEELRRREDALSSMLRLTGAASSEEQALAGLCELSARLLGEPTAAVSIVERSGDSLAVLGHWGFGAAGPRYERVDYARSLAAVVLERGEAGFLDDLALRPDIVVPQPAEGETFRAVAAAPLRIEGHSVGALKVYARRPHHWTLEQGRLLEWVAAQASRVCRCSTTSSSSCWSRRRCA